MVYGGCCLSCLPLLLLLHSVVPRSFWLCRCCCRRRRRSRFVVIVVVTIYCCCELHPLSLAWTLLYCTCIWRLINLASGLPFGLNMVGRLSHPRGRALKHSFCTLSLVVPLISQLQNWHPRLKMKLYFVAHGVQTTPLPYSRLSTLFWLDLDEPVVPSSFH